MIVVRAVVGALVVFGATMVGAQTFPPVAVTGPFPLGTEKIRHDSPVDTVRPTTPTVYHEYTCYKVNVPPVIDGKVESDPVWSHIPWTLMTWWESGSDAPAGTTTPTFPVWSGLSSPSWPGPTECSAWFKMVWDGSKVYIAIKAYYDSTRFMPDTTNPSLMHTYDCIQMSFNTTPPSLYSPYPVDPYKGCELGLALAQNGPTDSSELFTSWMPSSSNCNMVLAPGDNTRGIGAVKGRAFHITTEKYPTYHVVTYELAWQLTDTTTGADPWTNYIKDGQVGQFSILAMDWINSYSCVSWASGILIKDFTKFGSILWSPYTYDGKNLSSTIDRPETRNAQAVRSFSTQTGINYTVTQRAKIQLAVYSLMGKKIATLVDQDQAPGTYRVAFNKSQLSKGSYLYKIKAGSSESIYKMLVK